MNNQTLIDCHECDAEFYTSAKKKIGEKFNCPSCHHPMKAEDDYGEDGELIWYAITDREELMK